MTPHFATANHIRGSQVILMLLGIIPMRVIFKRAPQDGFETSTFDYRRRNYIREKWLEYAEHVVMH